MSIPIPKYPPVKKEMVPIKQDPVQRSMSRPDACAKPCSLSRPKGVRVRVSSGDKSLIRKKKRNWDKRDVHFY